RSARIRTRICLVVNPAIVTAEVQMMLSPNPAKTLAQRKSLRVTLRWSHIVQASVVSKRKVRHAPVQRIIRAVGNSADPRISRNIRNACVVVARMRAAAIPREAKLVAQLAPAHRPAHVGG